MDGCRKVITPGQLDFHCRADLLTTLSLCDRLIENKIVADPTFLFLQVMPLLDWVP